MLETIVHLQVLEVRSLLACSFGVPCHAGSFGKYSWCRWMASSAEAGAAFQDVVWDNGVLGPVPNDDFEEADGQQVFFSIEDEEAIAEDFFRGPPTPQRRAVVETTLPLRAPPVGLLPLACNGEIAGENIVAAGSVEETPLPKRRRLSGKIPANRGSTPPAPNRPVPLTPAQEEKMKHWKAQRKNIKRAMWVPAWIFCFAASVLSGSEVSYGEKKSRAIAVWQKQSDEERADLYERALREGWNRGKKGAPAGNQNARRNQEEPKSISGMGFLLTWHQEPVREGRLQALLNRLRRVDVESAEYERVMALIQEEPSAKTRWTEFQAFLTEILPRAAEVSEVSCCMEACLNGVEPRYHFHAMISNVKPDVGQDAMPVTLKLFALKYNGFLPHGQMAKGRGGRVIQSVDRGHCYSQLVKAGSIYQATNYPRGVAFVCKAEWILSQWKQRKLTADRARQEIIFSRDRVEASLHHLTAWQDLQQQALVEVRQRDAKAAFEFTKCGFKKIPQVDAWKEQYTAENAKGKTRFKFLILEGPSRFGKTRFACELFGSEFTCVINCQGVQQPYLARYDAGKHKAILLDEPSAELVGRCKVFLQAGLDGCELYQSATQRYTKWYCVYSVPIIICTNDWSSQHVKIGVELALWISQNSVHIPVKDFLYNKPVEEQS